MKAIKILVRSTAIAAVAALGLVAGVARADSDHDSADLVNSQASFVFAGLDWSTPAFSSSDVVTGRLNGQLTYHGVFAGCAKVRVLWRNAAGTQIANDASGEACSNTSLPSLPYSVSESYSDDDLKRAKVELLVKPFNGSYSVVASRTMKAGD
jgi:hypothetical protein